jgi:hypothetical protein
VRTPNHTRQPNHRKTRFIRTRSVAAPQQSWWGRLEHGRHSTKTINYGVVNRRLNRKAKKGQKNRKRSKAFFNSQTKKIQNQRTFLIQKKGQGQKTSLIIVQNPLMKTHKRFRKDKRIERQHRAK